jgi:hypothetical protein
MLKMRGLGLQLRCKKQLSRALHFPFLRHLNNVDANVAGNLLPGERRHRRWRVRLVIDSVQTTSYSRPNGSCFHPVASIGPSSTPHMLMSAYARAHYGAAGRLVLSFK